MVRSESTAFWSLIAKPDNGLALVSKGGTLFIMCGSSSSEAGDGHHAHNSSRTLYAHPSQAGDR